MLKLFCQDWSWAGSVVVVAHSEEEARAIMAAEYPLEYDPNKPLEDPVDIVEGAIIRSWGDS